LPRHGASLPIAIAVSCSADRQAKAKITKDGIFIEELETDPAQFLPDTTHEHLDENVVAIDLNQSMDDIRAATFQIPRKDAGFADWHHRGGTRYCACSHQINAG
jgi:fumarate hydratase class I